MFVKVFKLEEDQNPLTTFSVGVYTLGRGSALQCNDKRISRNHAVLEVNETGVKITSTHVNPCFLKASGSNTVTILAKDSSSELSDGDAFALLPDSSWFKIKIDLDAANTADEEDTHVHKRNLEDNQLESDTKRIKKEDEEENTTGDIVNAIFVKTEHEDSLNVTENIQNGETSNETRQIKKENEESNVPDGIQKSEPNIKVEPDDETKNSVGNTENDQQVSTSEGVSKDATPEGSTSQLADTTTNASSSSEVKSRRERCWYGAKCYRKNPAHRQEYTHPGDSDFESDPEDDRPVCSYGANCYRKNKEHRREYKHPPREPPNKLNNKRTRKKVNRLNAADYDYSDLSDTSDDDPFEADGDSDEYVGDSGSEDTDWEDSQNVDEDSENMKKLVKEAKRFAKKK